MKKTALSVVSALVSAPVLAHPEAAAHGNLLHFLLEPDHVAALGLLAVAVAGLVVLLRRGRREDDRS